MLYDKYKAVEAISKCSGIILFVGCTSHYGNQTLAKKSQADLKKELVKGKTTKAQVVEMYGKPEQTSFEDNGDEVILYSYSEGDFDATNLVPIVGTYIAKDEVRMKYIYIIFNKKGILKNYTITEMAQQTGRKGISF